MNTNSTNEQNISIMVNLTIEQITPILLELYPITIEGQPEHQMRIRPVEREFYSIGCKQETINKWFNDDKIPTNHKNMVINLFKLVTDMSKDIGFNFMDMMVYSDIIFSLIYNKITENLRFHLIKKGEQITTFAISFIINENYVSLIHDTKELSDKISYLSNQDINEWNVYKFSLIATIKQTEAEMKMEIDTIIKHIFNNNNKKKLISIGFDHIHDLEKDSLYMRYVLDILDMYNIEEVADKYTELYMTLNEDNEKMYLEKCNLEFPFYSDDEDDDEDDDDDE